MRLLTAALALSMALVASGAHAAGIVETVGSASAAGATEVLTVQFERDFSGSYGVATWITPEAMTTAYLDCVWFQPGEGKGTGEVVASGLVTTGPLPVLRPITVRIVATGTAGSFGVAEGVRGTGSTCGAELVRLRPAAGSAFITL